MPLSVVLGAGSTERYDEQLLGRVQVEYEAKRARNGRLDVVEVTTSYDREQRRWTPPQKRTVATYPPGTWVDVIGGITNPVH